MIFNYLKNTLIISLIYCSFFLHGMLQATEVPYKKPNEAPPFVILGSRSNGMFSIFDDVLALLQAHSQGHYTGIEINFGKKGLYYDARHGENWWNYYCKPIQLGEIVNQKRVVGKTKYAFKIEHTISRDRAFSLIQKYIHVKPHILKKINNFEKSFFKKHFVIGVHYRGTDKAIEAPRVPYEKVIQKIKAVLKQQRQPCTIFVATDEQAFLNKMIDTFKELVCYNPNALRSINKKPVHTRKSTAYQNGEDALIDCLLLSRSNLLIRTSSNLSRWTTYFNPKMPVIVLSSRYGSKK